MQQYFQDLQGRLWDFLVKEFNETTQLSINIWEYFKPYFEKFVAFLVKFINLFSNYLYSSFNFLKKTFLNLPKETVSIKSILGNLYENNKYLTIGVIVFLLVVLFFWLAMIWHAKRHEIFHKKIWLAIVILLGPVGALIYFFFRKRKLEKEQSRQDKVMMSFFSPMNKRKES